MSIISITGNFPKQRQVNTHTYLTTQCTCLPGLQQITALACHTKSWPHIVTSIITFASDTFKMLCFYNMSALYAHNNSHKSVLEMLQILLWNNTQPCYCHVKMMGVNIKEMFNCTYKNLYPLKKKKWCKIHNIQTISKFGTTCHNKLL